MINTVMILCYRKLEFVILKTPHDFYITNYEII